MRIIFSRKGFDSSYGGCPSPLVDGRPLSLPIPVTRRSRTTFGHLPAPIPAMVADLSRGRLTGDHLCHLDPDLIGETLSFRAPGWRGSLGQVAQSQRHLENQGVEPGDLFVFWGLFRPVEQREGRWRYFGRPLHAAFGWLQIAEIVKHPGGGSHPDHPWLAEHPHAQAGWGADNTIYVARETLSGLDVDAPGYGTFSQAHPFSDAYGPSPSWWQVPAWLHAASGGTGMTYHPTARWLPDGRLRAAARGQEFVADIGDREDARAWIANLIGQYR